MNPLRRPGLSPSTPPATVPDAMLNPQGEHARPTSQWWAVPTQPSAAQANPPAHATQRPPECETGGTGVSKLRRANSPPASPTSFPDRGNSTSSLTSKVEISWYPSPPGEVGRNPGRLKKIQTEKVPGQAQPDGELNVKLRQQLGLQAALISAVCSAWVGAAPAPAADKPAGGDARDVVRGNTDFAFNLYARLRVQEGNLFLSPYSISTALALTYAGARGETARQMAEVLQFKLPPEQLHPAWARLEASVYEGEENEECPLHLANSLWGQKGFGFRKEYLSLARTHYGAYCREIDFAAQPELARDAINTWIRTLTEEMIQELLQPGDLDADTVLVLTNAILFEEKWLTWFDLANTKEGQFRVSKDKQVAVPLMHQTGRFPFGSTDKVDILELPYAGERFSMVLMLPKADSNLAELEQMMNSRQLPMWLKELHPEEVHVTLPRFKLDSRFELADVLKTMGMTDAFSGKAADFSGMAERPEIWIDDVIHEARVEVNETGTKAAAATAVEMKKTSIATTFKADRPFCFVIRDRLTGSILFLGRVVNPTE